MTPSERAEIFASLSRSIDKVPFGRDATFGLPKIPPVEVRRSLISSSSLSSVPDEREDRLRFVFVGCSCFLAFAAQSGVGFIFSNCLRRRRS